MVRPAEPTDHDTIVRIAASFGFDEPDSGVEHRYLQWISAAGRLLVADLDGGVVGFGASLPVPAPSSDPAPAVMICDLFVSPDAHGRGLGRQLAAALVSGFTHRITCSSGHPAAIATYHRLGMQPVDTAAYLRGVVGPARSTLRALQAAPNRGATDRPDLAHHWVERGVRLLEVLDEASTIVGRAMVIDRGDELEVARLVTSADPGQAIGAVLATLAGERVTTVVRQSAGSAIDACAAAGLAHVDSDTVMATSADLLPQALVAMHPALC
jgi:GNAT superfamily N-acetyltransferase